MYRRMTQHAVLKKEHAMLFFFFLSKKDVCIVLKRQVEKGKTIPPMNHFMNTFVLKVEFLLNTFLFIFLG